VAGGENATLIDCDGRRFTDLTSGWNVANTGWNHPLVVDRVRNQATQNLFAPSWCAHSGRSSVAERLAKLIGQEIQVICGCGGSEAIEAALKVARRATGRQAIVGFDEAFHGATLAAALAGGVRALHGVDVPSDALHRHAPLPDRLRQDAASYIRQAVEVITSEPHPAAVLLEAVFTNPGVIIGHYDFYAAIEAAARRVGALIIVDEIGTGFGRTGSMFAYQQFPIRPDIVVLGKAMTSGAVPMSAALIRRDLGRVVLGSAFDSTFGWTPLACAAATATLDVLATERLLPRAMTVGQQATHYLETRLAGCGLVREGRGRGLELGLELSDTEGRPLAGEFIRRILAYLLQRGVFAEFSRYTSTLLIMPPLTIPEDQLLDALGVVCDCVEDVATIAG